MSVELLRRGDPRYPASLGLLNEPPELLYAQGDLSLLDKPRVSIIGSREPSDYGERMAFEAASALAFKGAVIVSGMALGLDACAHAGALEAGGGTIAVLGTGIDIDYPQVNSKLLTRVRRDGLVLTEFEPGDKPLKWHFTKRNRIIAALAHVLLVVEGRIKGGTSNTAKWAGEAGITMFGVPGRLDDELAQSPNTLIRDGANIYTHANDILLKLGLPVYPEAFEGPERKKAYSEFRKQARPGLAGAEAVVFDLIRRKPLHVDEISAKSEIDAGLLLAALSSLELQGLITQLPGKHFALAS
jgi:DNA processing protein